MACIILWQQDIKHQHDGVIFPFSKRFIFGVDGLDLDKVVFLFISLTSALGVGPEKEGSLSGSLTPLCSIKLVDSPEYPML